MRTGSGGGRGMVRRSDAEHADRMLSRRSGAAATLILLHYISGPQATALHKSSHDADLEATGFNLYDVPQSLNHHKSMSDRDLGGTIGKLLAPLNATELQERESPAVARFLKPDALTCISLPLPLLSSCNSIASVDS